MRATSQRPDVAIIGAGLMGRWHAASARGLGAHIVGIVDSDTPRARTLGRASAAPAFADVSALLAQVRPDVVHVCTPAQTHVPLIRTLLEARCDIVCEKPLAAAAPDVAELFELARRAGRRICPTHQFATQEGVRRVIHSRRELGELKSIAFEICSAGAEPTPSRSCDEVLIEILPHPLSVLAKLLPHTRLEELQWTLAPTAAGELHATACAEQVPISIFVSLSARPTRALARILGTRGSAALDFFHGFGLIRGGGVSRARKLLQPFGESLTHLTAAAANLSRRILTWEPAYPGLRTLIEDCYAARDSAARAPFGEEEVLGVYRARDVLAGRLLQRALHAC
jgi:predicted dehydrogenase